MKKLLCASIICWCAFLGDITPTLADELPIAAVTASANDGNVPANTIDNDFGTRWSAFGNGQWIRYDLGSVKTIEALSIAFFKGNERRARFDLQVSSDRMTWTTVLSGTSSGATLAQERFDFTPVQARYVRYLGHGNTSNMWNSLTEVDVLGPVATPPPAPSGLRATAGDQQVQLAWDAVSGATTYKLYRDDALIASPTATSHTDIGLTNGTTYRYQVSTVNAFGEGPKSGVVTAVPGGAIGVECPAYPAFPNASCTGYKPTTGFTSDTQLTRCREDDGEEDGHFTKANVVYDRCLFTFVRIRAPNITIKNSKIQGVIMPPAGHHEHPYDYQGLKLINVEITPFSDAELESFCSPKTWIDSGLPCEAKYGFTPTGRQDFSDLSQDGPIGDGSNFICDHCYIHHGAKSAGGGSGARYIDSYVHSLTWTPDQHGAAIGINNGIDVQFIHNNLSSSRWNTGAPGFQQGSSSALSIYDEGPLDGVLVKNNLLNTAGQYCAYSGGPTGRNVQFIGNHFGKTFYPNCGAAGPLHSWYPENPGYLWLDNVWDDGSGPVNP